MMMISNAGRQNIGFGKLVQFDEYTYLETESNNPVRFITRTPSLPRSTDVHFKPAGAEEQSTAFKTIHGSNIHDVACKLNKQV